MTVDCEKLNKEIKELEERLSRVQGELESISNDDEGKKKIDPLGSEILGLEEEKDRVLEEYLEEFFEKNPELRDFSFGEKIVGFSYEIKASEQLSPSEILVMGEKGETMILRKQLDENGQESWKYGEKINGFGNHINASEKLSDSEILVMGAYGETRILKKQRDENGQESWEYGEKITGVRGDIKASEKLSDSEILVMGGHDETRILRRRRDENGQESWKYDEEITGFGGYIHVSEQLSPSEILVMGIGGRFNTKILRKVCYSNTWERWKRWRGGYKGEITGFGNHILASEKLSDSEILVMGDCGETRILRKQRHENGWESWEYDSEKISGFGRNRRQGASIWTSERLSDSEILVMGEDGETRILRKQRDENGQESWEYGEEITGFSNRIDASEKLSDSEILVMGDRGETRILKAERNLEVLKKNLGRMIEKKGGITPEGEETNNGRL